MIKRRAFLKTLAFGIIGWGIAPDLMAQTTEFVSVPAPEHIDSDIKDYLHKMVHFDRPHKDDIYISKDLYRVFCSVVIRLERMQNFVGHGNFQILGLDDARSIARNYSEVGEIPDEELNFLEMIFYEDAGHYGFFGKKPLKKFTEQIRENDVYKVPYTGNYLYKGEPLERFQKIKKQIGNDLILTSGVRGIMKQCFLYLKKAYRNGGDLSLASRSLAPPGYSYHGIGDFDVGQVGFGAANFTDKFADTEIYRRLNELGHLKLRYYEHNLLGVRFEPWHIKISADI